MAASSTSRNSSAPLSAPPLAPAPFRVTARRVETPDTVTFTLESPNGNRVPPFDPGQFNMLYAFGVGESAISICGDPQRRGEIVHTVRRVGRVTEALSNARTGSVLGVRGPYGRGWPLDPAKGGDVIVMAGGLGLPPLRPLIYRLLAERDEFGRVEVVYGARTPKDLVFYDQLQTWRHRGDTRFQVTVDAAGRDWYGDVGVVTQRIPDMRFDAEKTVAFLCGPEIMMRLSAEALEARGVRPDRIFVSLERNMKCAIAQCGHCQFGPAFVCREGPVFRYGEIRSFLKTREV